MAVVSGDFVEVTYNHPTVGSGTLYIKGGEDSTIDLGGFRTGDDANSVDGGGRMMRQMNRVRWSAELSVSWDMNVADEASKINDLCNYPVEADWTFTHINGTVWAGTGVPVGDIQPNANSGMFTLKISGGGFLEKISG